MRWVLVCVLMWLPVYDHVQRMPKTETTTHCCNIRYKNGSLTHFAVQPSYDKLIITARMCPCLMKQICVVSGLSTTACIEHGARPKNQHREATDRFSLSRDFAANSFFFATGVRRWACAFLPRDVHVAFLQNVSSVSKEPLGRQG